MSKIIKFHNYVYKYSTNFIIFLGAAVLASYLLGIRIYCVKTGSMGDVVPVGSVCFVSRYSQYENVVPGEIIAFNTSENMRVTHRAVEVSEQGITTRGDCNNVNDPELVTKETYIGTTIFCIPYLGHFIECMHTRGGLAAIALIILLIQISGVIYNKTSCQHERV